MAEFSLVIGVGYLIGRLGGWAYTLVASWLVIFATPAYLQAGGTSIAAISLLALGALCFLQIGSIVGMIDRESATAGCRFSLAAFAERLRRAPISELRHRGDRCVARNHPVKSVDATRVRNRRSTPLGRSEFADS